MTLPDDDLVPVTLEEFADLESDSTLPLVPLNTVLNRPPSRRKRRFYIGSILLVCLIFLLLLWQAFLTLPRVVATIRATTPTPFPPTPTLVAGGTISATIPIGAVHEHTSIAASDTAVWVHDGPTGTVTRIDPRTNTVVATIVLEVNPQDTNGGTIAIGQQAVWVTEGGTGIVSRIDPQSNQVTATTQLTPGTGILGVSPGTVWVINVPNNTLTKVDEQTNQVVATLSTPSLPIGVSYGAGSVWLCSRTAGVIRIDPQTNQVLAQIDVGSAHAKFCNGIAALAQAVWVPIFDEVSPLRQHLLERIDPATNTVTDTIELGADMETGAANEQEIWVCDPTTGLLRVDPQRRRVVAQLKLPGGDNLALGAGSLWLTRTSDNSVVRITPAP